MEPESHGSLGDRLDRLRAAASRRWQRQLDLAVPWVASRWLAVGFAILLFLARVIWMVHGFYIVTYALGIYMLSLLIGFLSPLDDPDADSTADLPVTTSKNDDEFRPFVRKLPEFKFWYQLTKAVAFAFAATFVPFLDIPVFWPILVIYFIALVVIQLRARISHMKKYGYVPFSLGKPKFMPSGAQPSPKNN